MTAAAPERARWPRLAAAPHPLPRPGPRTSPQVGWAWQRRVTTGGTVPIGQIADEVGWSHKHLMVQFRRQAGLRPKTAARLIRFDRV
jgi:methylphosphotriester-DNA--protein-cysteine methyltransferase